VLVDEDSPFIAASVVFVDFAASSFVDVGLAGFAGVLFVADETSAGPGVREEEVEESLAGSEAEAEAEAEAEVEAEVEVETGAGEDDGAAAGANAGADADESLLLLPPKRLLNMLCFDG